MQLAATITPAAANTKTGSWTVLPAGAAVSVLGPARSRICASNAAVKAMFASSGGAAGATCCAAKAACDYKAADVFVRFVQPGARPDSC